MLEDLEARWRDERTPQAGVRLAKALQQEGDKTRAEGILAAVERQLAAEPRDLASRVAVGGLRLALGQPEDAARILEEVVQGDPTHLKANKLLVEVYLELNQRERARDRLDLYRLLNQGDPEIESLEGLLIGDKIPTATLAVIPAGLRGGRHLSVGGDDPFAGLTAEPPRLGETGSLFELSPPPPPSPPVATATLGALYQEQGHSEEAARVFHDVLEREPDNLRAQEGLAALGEVGEPEPAAVVAPAVDEDAEGDRQRRIALLHEYLARIQRGRGAAAQ
jgi:tetratricopeptide (TPR) repeat protein